MKEPEKPACPHCQGINTRIMESIKHSESLYQRKYRCFDCSKFFFVIAESQFQILSDEIVYTLRLRYGRLPSVATGKPVMSPKYPLEVGLCR